MTSAVPPFHNCTVFDGSKGSGVSWLAWPYRTSESSVSAPFFQAGWLSVDQTSHAVPMVARPCSHTRDMGSGALGRVSELHRLFRAATWVASSKLS